ncbi:kinase-like protein, partial [Stipitochalara longipes BDJ]
MQPPEISQPDGDDVDKDKDNGDDPDDDPNFGGSHGANHGFEFFDDLDNFDFGPSFDGDGSGHNFSYDASGSYHYQTSFPDLDLGRAATSLGQALASERQSLLQQFSFVRTLGSGGFGRVDEVTCNELRQRFALKILRRPIPGIKSSSQVAAFRNEVEILKTLKHPHIIRFAGSRVYGNAFSILMYPVVKENLATYLAQLDGKLHRSLSANSTSQTALNVLWTLMGCFASALSNIHSVNIIHGDLKPENILIDGAQIFLSDFGSAKKLSNDSNPLEAMCILSPEFAAPEAIKYGQKDTAGDIWSFGCILTLVVT